MINKIEIVEEEIAKENDEIDCSKSLKDRFIESVMKYQPFAEKMAAVITTVDSVIDPFNKIVEPHTPFVNYNPVSIYANDDRKEHTIDQFLEEKGYAIESNCFKKVAEGIFIIGSDNDEALTSLEEKNQ